MDEMVAVDSNCLSFLADAIFLGQKPKDNLADQKIALLRIFLYREEGLYEVPILKDEYERIKDENLKKAHNDVARYLLVNVPEVDQRILEDRIAEYSLIHKGEKNYKDCRILSEAELGGCDCLLTYDSTFLKRLKDKTHNISMIAPLQFWDYFKIPHNAKPKIGPHQTNPLAQQDWWKW